MKTNKELVDKFPISLFAKFCDEIGSQHEKAIAKHPMMGMKGMHDMQDFEKSMFKEDTDELKRINNKREKANEFNWYDLLFEETAEAYYDISNKNYGNAQAELVQVAQVAFRAWLWCEEQKQKKEIRK